MLRAAAYLVLGWMLIAMIGGLADVLTLTVMLPATSAVVITHIAFARKTPVPAGLAVAVALGYLEDLHQGAPVGTLCLAHALAFLALHWSARRFHLGNWVVQAIVSVLGVLLVDLITLAVLMVLSEPFGVRTEALLIAVADVRWHALATLLAAPPLWWLIDHVFVLLRIDDPPPPPPGPWGVKR